MIRRNVVVHGVVQGVGFRYSARIEARRLGLAGSSRRIASAVGIPIRTSYQWCGWLRNAALSYARQRQWAEHG